MSGVSRVITGVSGSPGSVRALRYAADLARVHDAALLPVLAWVPPGGDLADRRYPSPYLRQVWKEAADQQLSEAIVLAFGCLPDDIALRPSVLRGEPGRVLVTAASEPGDLLVVGAGPHGTMRRMSGGRTARFCLAHAACPVVAVPPSGLAAATTGIRGWTLRHRNVAYEDAELSGPKQSQSR